MKLAVAFAALVSVFGFSSCLNSDGDGGTSYDGFDFVTVKDGYMGGTYLASDNGLTLKPVASTVLAPLALKDGGYYTRSYIGFKLPEGEIASEGKTSYNIAEIGIMYAMPYKGFNMDADTLKADYPIVSFEASILNFMTLNHIWAKNGYVNIPFTFKTTQTLSPDAFHLYVTGIKEDTLYTQFRQSIGNENAYQTGGGVISFSLPFNNFEFDQLYRQLEEKQDSIVIKVSAKGENGILVKTAKYRTLER